jgi:uncharacterized membrane protein
MTALVVILQLMGAFIKLGIFSISAVLVPIVVGAAIGGKLAGAWLGLVFGITVLLSGDASSFLVVDPFGTVLTVLAKGILCGFVAGVVYELVMKRASTDGETDTVNPYGAANEPRRSGSERSLLAVMLAAIICPLVNTGVFLIGTFLFFWDTAVEWAGTSAVGGVIFFLIGFNWIFEIVLNVVLVPVIVRLLKLVKTA